VIVVVAAVIERDGSFLVTRRLENVHLAGMWEFPGGKLDPGETHVDALKRELLEELDVEVDVGELLLQTTHAYKDVHVVLYFYSCTLHGTPVALLGQDMRWVARHELSELGFPEADGELIKLLTTSAAH
jgi:mutator protein MutT